MPPRLLTDASQRGGIFMASNDQQRSPSSTRGFAGMDAEKQRQISAKGGRASHQKGTGHEFTSEEAREAGRKGGQASRGRRAQPHNLSESLQ